MAISLVGLDASLKDELADCGFGSDKIREVEKEVARLTQWCAGHGQGNYDHELCEQYSKEQFGCCVFAYGRLEDKQEKRRSSLRTIVSMAEKGTCLYHVSKSRSDFSGRCRKLFEGYLSKMEEENRAQSTIQAKHGYLYDFELYLEAEGINLSEITPGQLEAFFYVINKPLASTHAYRKAVRNFLAYLYSIGETADDLSIKVQGDRYATIAMQKVPTVLDLDEAAGKIERIDRSMALGKRDYAMILLIAHLGLRPGDLVALTFDDFDWDRSRLVFRQQKTGILVDLVITAAVGNAVVDYIRNGRPKTGNKCVFVVHGRSRDGMSLRYTRVSEIIRKHLGACKTICGDKRLGARVLRSTVASTVLAQGGCVSDVSSILGHASVNTAKHYIAVDFEGLKRCALPIPPVKSTLYPDMQEAQE